MHTYTIGNSLIVSTQTDKNQHGMGSRGWANCTVDNSPHIFHVPDIVVGWAPRRADLVKGLPAQARHDGWVHCEEVDDE